MALLTLAEARTHITTSLVDAALQRLLDAAEDAITDAIGPVGNVTETFTAGAGDLIMLSRRASAVVSVNERASALNANDYELYNSGQLLHRRDLGTNPDSRWRGRVIVVYTPVSDVARRKVAQLALVNLDLTFNPGAASERIGDWTETYRTDAEYVQERRAILASLSAPVVLI